MLFLIWYTLLTYILASLEFQEKENGVRCDSCNTGWPADLEFLETWKSQRIWKMSGNFMKCGKVREFQCEIGKSQGTLLAWNKYHRSLKFIQEWTRTRHACSYITHGHGFLFKNKNEFKLLNSLFLLLLFWIRKCTVTG